MKHFKGRNDLHFLILQDDIYLQPSLGFLLDVSY